MVTTTINGVEYPLATTLRVAYQVPLTYVSGASVGSTYIVYF